MITLTDFTIGYGSRRLLRDVNTRFDCGRLVTLVGRNGCGKSTLLRAIAGLSDDYSGRLQIDGVGDIHDRHAMARAIAYVNTSRPRIANMICRDIVALGRAPFTNWAGHLSEADRAAVDRALSVVGMSDYANRAINTLSDGESQRIMIARAIAQDTPAIILDEPTSFLDIPNRRHLMTLLATLAHDMDKCIVMSTHELELALDRADAIALIADATLRQLSTSDPATRLILDAAFA